MSSGDRRPFYLIVSNSTVIMRQLRGGGFRRLALRCDVVDSGAEALTRLLDKTPDAVVLEARLPDTEAFSTCARIRATKSMAGVAVVIICEGSISRELWPQITVCGCDELLSAPLSRGQLYEVLAERLGLPRRAHYRVNVRAQVTARGTRVELRGETRDLAVTGARLRLEGAFTEGEDQLELSLDLGGGEGLLELPARLVWHRPYACGSELAVQFLQVSPEVARRLEVLATYRIEPQEGGSRIVLQQALTERSCFEGLAARLGPRVEVDLRHVTLVNSLGVSRWVSFMRTIPPETVVELIHCSVAFCTQASYVPQMLGSARVRSFFAPFYCPSCDRDLEREFAVHRGASAGGEQGEVAVHRGASAGGEGEVRPEELARGVLPTVRCPTCDEVCLFEEDPESYLQVLTQDRRC